MSWNLRKPNTRRAILVSLCGLFLGLGAYQLWGENGYVALRRKRQEEREWRVRNETLQRRNEQLQRRIHGLQTDPKVIEKIAREELLLAKPEDKIILTPHKK